MEHGDDFDLQSTSLQRTRVASIERLAPDIVGLELRPLERGGLMPFSAGAHVDLHLPGGISRSYSLLNDSAESNRYRLAVKREAESRGGSAWIHSALKVGDCLETGRPRNNFLLEENAPCSVLFAGGIGVTPLLAMARRLCRLRRPFHFHYGARSRAEAALVDEVEALDLPFGATLSFHFEDEARGRIDFAAAADGAPEGSHFYCCGPGAMISAFENRLAHIAPGRLHSERFSADAIDADQGGFEVVLARSARSINVPVGMTILDAILDAGIDVDFSCMEGFCGSCRAAVLEGEPVHNDTVLSPAERADGKVMMICCSTVAGERLVLDI